MDPDAPYRDRATPDSPQQRDDKADVIEKKRVGRARGLAAELRRFQWEMRFYIIGIIIWALVDK